MNIIKAQELVKLVNAIDQLIASGMSPFKAMAVILDEEDWLLVYNSFKALVKDAVEATQKDRE